MGKLRSSEIRGGNPAFSMRAIATYARNDVVHPDNLIRGRFKTHGLGDGANWDSTISQNALQGRPVRSREWCVNREAPNINPTA